MTITFTTEAERQRAREACAMVGAHCWRSVERGDESWRDAFDRLYPPVVDAPEPYLPGMLGDDGIDPDVRTARTPTPSPAFEAALDELEDAVRHHLFNAQSTARRVAARAEVLRLYREARDA